MKKFYIATFSVGNLEEGKLKIGIQSFEGLSFAQCEEQFNTMKAEMLVKWPDAIIELLQIGTIQH